MRGFCCSIVALMLLSNLKAAPVSLNAPARTGSQFRFTISGESNTAYIVEATTNLQTWASVATNFDISAQRTVTLNAQREREYFRARQASPLFRFALAVTERIDLNGRSLYSDSFDSADPNASTNGRYDPSKTRDNGDVAAYPGITNYGGTGRIELLGHVWTGPNVPAPILGPFDSIGSLAWHNSGYYGIEPGWWFTNWTPSFPQISVPWAGGFAPAGDDVDGEYYDYVLHSANYQMASLRMRGDERMMVVGNAHLYITSEFAITANTYIQLHSPTSSLTLYVSAPASFIGGNGIVAPTFASNFTYYGLPSNTNLSLAITSVTGRFYAPNAECLYIATSTNTTATLIGSCTVKSLSLGSSLRVHYDENLRRCGPFY